MRTTVLAVIVLISGCSTEPDETSPACCSNLTIAPMLADNSVVVGDDSIFIRGIGCAFSTPSMHRTIEAPSIAHPVRLSSHAMTVANNYWMWADSSGAVHSGCRGYIDSAVYDRLDIRLRRFTDDEVTAYARFPDQAQRYFTSPERSSFVVDGYITLNGVQAPFTYSTTTTDSISIGLDDYLVDGIRHQTIYLKLDPTRLFIDSTTGSLIDPRIASNRTLIDASIPAAITSVLY